MTIYYNRLSEKHLRHKLRRDSTPEEKILWNILRNRQLIGTKFRRQYSVGKFVIDFYCPDLKLAIESDGVIHDEADVKGNDKIRQNYLESFGIKFIRIKNEELNSNIEEVTKIIQEEIKSRKAIMDSIQKDRPKKKNF